MRSSRLDLLRAVAAPRDGVVSRMLLLQAGFDPELALREVEAGRWQELAPFAYLVTDVPATLRQRCYAAVLHAGRDALITGLAGCHVRGVKGLPVAAAVDVLVDHDRRRVSTSAVALHRTRDAATGNDVAQGPDLLPLLVADVLRCVADAVRYSQDLRSARSVGTTCLRDRRVDWSAVAAEALRPGRGNGHLLHVVRDVADGVRSPAEGDLHDTLAPASRKGVLPPYLLNPDVYLDGVLLGSPDAWFPGLGLGDEQDSREWHGAPDALDATLLRHERWRRAGLHLHHSTPTRLRGNPTGHVRELVVLVDERRRLVRPEPAGLVVLGRGPLLPARTPWPQVTGRRAA